MTLNVLIDNNTYIDQYYMGEPALSFYIEDGNSLLLFDTGYSGAFLDNLNSMGLDHRVMENIILSHGHNDHTGGLSYIPTQEQKGTIYGHPQVFKKSYEDGHYIGTPIIKEELQKHYKLVLSKEPIQVSENIIFLGEIPSTFDFEKRRSFGQRIVKGEGVPDFIPDDSAIVYKGVEGLTVISGCSHSGICNIIERAKEVCQCNKVQGVIGGFHLFEKGERVEKTVNYLSSLNLDIIYPCHCTSFEVKAALHRIIPVGEVGVGMKLEWK